MKIKLKTGFCEMRECELTMDRKTLHLTSEDGDTAIPLQDMTRFTLDIGASGAQHFQLEVGDRLYQGRFLRREDASWVAQQLGQHNSHCIQFIFDP